MNSVASSPCSSTLACVSIWETSESVMHLRAPDCICDTGFWGKYTFFSEQVDEGMCFNIILISKLLCESSFRIHVLACLLNLD